MSVCPHLKVLVDYEISHGNAIDRVEARPEIDIDCFVLMKNRLNIWGTPETGKLPRGVRYWDRVVTENAAEAGFSCSEHKCIVAGLSVD